MQVIRCIETGLPLLIENLPEDIEAVLDPVIGKRTFRRGNATLIRLGDAEVQVHAKFRCRSSPRWPACRNRPTFAHRFMLPS